MVRKVFVLVLIAVFTGIAPVAAGQGTLHTTDLAQFGPPLPDAALDGVRGGFNGLAFSVFLSTFVTSTNDLAGALAVNVATSNTPPGSSSGGSDFSAQSASSQNSAVRTATVAGNFGGATGIFQFALVPGNNNIVLNTLNIQLIIVNVPNGAAVPSLSSLLR